MERHLAFEPRARQAGPLLISEIILENFMSYEYARMPLKPGLNLVCGPNGSGKSSILLGISVALGQTYTERSRKLSDLIRRGKEVGRVSLLFDNRPREGRRPVTFCKSDTFMLSRYLKLDGSYWYEADYREISKSEVTRLLRRLGISPDNLLIIMHQGMLEEFSVTGPQEKLRMVEEAVGFKEYREKILEARGILEGIVSEEASLLQLIERAGETRDYWKGIYERYLVKRGLSERKLFLEREFVWAQVSKHERTLGSLRERLEGRTRVLKDIVEKMEKTRAAVAKTQEGLSGQRTQLRKLYFSLTRLEKEATEADTSEALLAQNSEDMAKIKASLEPVLEKLEEGPLREDEDFKGPLKALQGQREAISHILSDSLEKVEDFRRRGGDLRDEIQALQVELDKAEQGLSALVEKYVGLRVDEAVLGYRKKNVEQEINEVKRGIKEVEEQLASLAPEVERAGERVSTEKLPSEVLEEIRIVGVQLKAVADVPEEAEKIYSSYATTYEELRQRLQTISENKKKALEEVELRKKVWRDALNGVMGEVSPVYQDILSKVDAVGSVRLSNADDVEAAGLELTVGFRGAPAMVLDAYTQSGGERSVAVMAFLISLQQRLLSPFRAIDEFDVHCDPLNREMVMKMIFQMMKDVSSQCIVITPGSILAEGEAHVIVVQNVGGSSKVSEAKA